MPKLTEMSIALRQKQVLEVMALKFNYPDKPITELCEMANIEPRTFYTWLDKSEDMVSALSELITSSQRTRLFLIESYKLRAVEKLIAKGLNEITDVGDQLKILAALSAMGDELQEIHHARPGIEQDAYSFLQQGPELELQKSRLASIEVREDATEGVTIDIYKEQPVINSHFDDEES